MTLTKERLIALSNRENVGAIYAEEIVELARIALASLTAEPVAWIIEGGKNNAPCHLSSHKEYVEAYPDRDVTPLYAAPPAPVSVPDEAIPQSIEILASTYAPRGVTYQWDKDECNAAADSWNACRAAMLKTNK